MRPNLTGTVTYRNPSLSPHCGLDQKQRGITFGGSRSVDIKYVGSYFQIANKSKNKSKKFKMWSLKGYSSHHGKHFYSEDIYL